MKRCLIACLVMMAVLVWGQAVLADGLGPFEQLEDVTFTFASGVGGWSTQLWIGPDGSFWGRYSDSDMGTSGPGYDYGTVYLSQFTGVFSSPEQVDEYTWRFHMDYVTCLETPGEVERIRDQVRYVSSEPYGVEGGSDFELYLPGKPVSELSEEYRSWVRYSVQDKEVMDAYGLYNVNQENGFSGYLEQHREEDGFWKEEMSLAWQQARPIYEKLLGDVPQQTMNEESAGLYEIWDRCLNNLWGYLGERLDSERMDALTREELDWIRAKEEKIVEAGSLFLHGSLQPYMENITAANFTRLRVYELWKLYRYALSD